MKNLLRVNAKKESLSNEANYSILRHCALSQLFQFQPNNRIPNYAWRNFLTKFTYESSESSESNDSKQQFVKYSITNNAELTDALEVAATIRMIELDGEYDYDYEKEFDVISLGSGSGSVSNKSTSSESSISSAITAKESNRGSSRNIIILDIHCEFINLRSIHAHQRRKDATIAADHVVKTLQEWIQKASAFVVDHASRYVVDRDYVVVKSTDKGMGSAATSTSTNNKNTKGSGKKLNEDEDEDEGNDRRQQHHPMEWAKRFVQVLLVPENNKDSPVMVEHSHCSHNNNKGFVQDAHDLLDEYEESLEVLAASFVHGLRKTSKFIQRVVKEHQENTKKSRSSLLSIHNEDHQDCLSLSASSTPSLVKSVSSISSSSSHGNDIVVEQGIEIIFDPNNNHSDSNSRSSSSNGDKDEWKIFFGESTEEKKDGGEEEEEEAVMISNPCEEEVISISSYEHNSVVLEDSTSTASSFEQVSEANNEDNDDVSWAMLSDDE